MAFNMLSAAEAERLAILAEELGEAVQAVGKILRHGYESENPADPTHIGNRHELEKELGDIAYIIRAMDKAKDINAPYIERLSYEKAEKIHKYLHHQAASPEPPTGEKR